MNINQEMYEFYEQYIISLQAEQTLTEALLYSFKSNGKLFRPHLMWTMLKDLSVEQSHLPIAAAIEMIHTYSLVHDDLPAMDDDDYRRGKLTCHKVFGEDIAILTGDALLTHAFDLIASSELGAAVKVEMIKAFTNASGASGMIAGQVMDVKNENDPNLTESTLELIHDKKTALMIELPIKCALLIAGVENDEALKAARKLGLFYQIQDDYLDTYGDFEKMGKMVNADSDKVTYTTLYSKNELEQYMSSLASEIANAYTDFTNTKELVNTIIQREG